MRDNIIIAGDALDHNEQCHDLVCFRDTRIAAQRYCRGSSVGSADWEVTEMCARECSSVLRGCLDCWFDEYVAIEERGETSALEGDHDSGNPVGLNLFWC